MQAMHGRLSDPVSYQALQQFITDSPRETRLVWAQLRAVVQVRRGILAVDDTSFPKQGRHSVVVQRQYCGALGKIANCQVAVSTVLLGAQLTWPLSFELCLLTDSLTDSCAAGQRADFRGSAHSPEMAHRPGAYPSGPHGRLSPHGRGGGLRLRVECRVSPRSGAPRAALRRGHPVGADDVDARRAAVRVRPAKSRGERWLLCERSLIDDERKYYLLNLDATATLRTLVTVARSRWPIEQLNRELKDELGLDHFEGRSYRGRGYDAVLTAPRSRSRFSNSNGSGPLHHRDRPCHMSASGCGRSWRCCISSATASC